MASLLLYYQEHKWMEKTKKVNLQPVRKCSYALILIDDLCVFHEYNETENNCKETHPKELQLKKENKYSTNVTLLHLEKKNPVYCKTF